MTNHHLEKTALIRQGCWNPNDINKPISQNVRDSFNDAVSAVDGCTVIPNKDELKFYAPSEEKAEEVAELLKNKIFGFMGLYPPKPSP